jgi:quinolinate synthase
MGVGGGERRGLMEVCELVGTEGERLLEGFKPRAYTELVEGQRIAAAGCLPILHMRDFQSSGKLPPALEADVLQRAQLSAR